MELTAHITYQIDNQKKTAKYDAIFLHNNANKPIRKLKSFWLLDVARLKVISMTNDKLWFTEDFVKFSAYKERHSKIYRFLRKHKLVI